MNKILAFIFLATIPSFIDSSEKSRPSARYNLSKEQEVICKAQYQTTLDIGQTKYHAIHAYNHCARNFTQNNKKWLKAQQQSNPKPPKIKPASSRVEKPTVKNDEAFTSLIQQILKDKPAILTNVLSQENSSLCPAQNNEKAFAKRRKIKNIIYTITGDLDLAEKINKRAYESDEFDTFKFNQNLFDE